MDDQLLIIMFGMKIFKHICLKTITPQFLSKIIQNNDDYNFLVKLQTSHKY